MKRILFLFCIAIFSFNSRAGDDKQEVVVFAAASLTEAFKSIGKQFEEKNKGVSVTFSFGASNQLRLQIEQGASADVFASANTKEMETLVKNRLVKENRSMVFARNRLVLIVPRDNPGKIEKLSDLAKPGLKLILAHENVPVGKYSLEMLAKAAKVFGEDFDDAVLRNVVSKEENVKAVVSKVQLSNADAGIAYVSDVTPKALKELKAIDIPEHLNLIASYPIAPLENSKRAELAAKFVDFVLSDTGQQALTDQRFLPANTK